jgi:hypothetical protein
VIVFTHLENGAVGKQTVAAWLFRFVFMDDVLSIIEPI